MPGGHRQPRLRRSGSRRALAGASRAARGRSAASLADAPRDRGTQTSKRLRRTASRTAAATSSGVTTGSARGRAKPSIIAVSTSADCTTVNATPLPRYSIRSDSVRPTTPCLVAAYVALPGSGKRPTPEAMLTRCPPWRGSIRWSASLDPRAVPYRLTSISRRVTSSGSSVERADPFHARVVDHHAQRAAAPLGRVEERRELVRVGSIQRNREDVGAGLRCDRLGRGHVDIADGHARPRLAPDAGRSLGRSRSRCPSPPQKHQRETAPPTSRDGTHTLRSSSKPPPACNRTSPRSPRLRYDRRPPGGPMASRATAALGNWSPPRGRKPTTDRVAPRLRRPATASTRGSSTRMQPVVCGLAVRRTP